MGIKHKFLSPKTDGSDSTVVRPSNWNDNHTTDFDEGSIPFITSTGDLSEDPVNLFWDNVTKTFRVPTLSGSSSPSGNVQITSTTDTTKGKIKLGDGDEIVIDETTGNVGVGVPEPKAKLHCTTSTILGVSGGPIDSGDINNGEVNVYVDEVGNLLTFKVKYSNGTVKTGTVALI